MTARATLAREGLAWTSTDLRAVAKFDADDSFIVSLNSSSGTALAARTHIRNGNILIVDGHWNRQVIATAIQAIMDSFHIQPWTLKDVSISVI